MKATTVSYCGFRVFPTETGFKAIRRGKVILAATLAELARIINRLNGFNR